MHLFNRNKVRSQQERYGILATYVITSTHACVFSYSHIILYPQALQDACNISQLTLETLQALDSTDPGQQSQGAVRVVQPLYALRPY